MINQKEPNSQASIDQENVNNKQVDSPLTVINLMTRDVMTQFLLVTTESLTMLKVGHRS